MLLLEGGDLVLPDRILKGTSLLIEDGRIAAVTDAAVAAGVPRMDVSGASVLPGFVDVHVHGVDGVDLFDGEGTIAAIAARLPRYGVTAFCPTTIACTPRELNDVLAQVRRAREAPAPFSAQVLRAHLESNFLNPEFRGAQPAVCLRVPDESHAEAHENDFAAHEIVDAILAAAGEVAIVTLAPELPGSLHLIHRLVEAGLRVSLGHTGASFEQAMTAIDSGARHATHLFNRMSQMTSRAPGVVGAVLARNEVAAELICDGVHVHAALCHVAIATKGPHRIMAITDGTAASGLAHGATARLGQQAIQARHGAARLGDGTLAGSVQTMDGALRYLVNELGVPLVDAATMCATTPAHALGLADRGALLPGAAADLVVLDRALSVVATFVDGIEAYVR